MIALLFMLGICLSGLAKEVKEGLAFRSSSLSLVYSNEGMAERIDYVDENGIITYAEDKHYATKIRTKSDNSVLEQYYDANGNPAKQKIGHYEVLYSLNAEGLIDKITYLDKNAQPMITSAGYAIIRRTYNDKGLLETEYFYDEKEQPVRTYTVCSGCKRFYDENGNNTKLVYLDADGEISKTGLGYAVVHKTFYEEGADAGRIKDEFYYDENDKPIKLSNGQYGINKEYDEYGRVTNLCYLGIDGNRIMNTAGYSLCKRTFYEDDSICTETYYDEQGKPVALSEGQYGILHTKDGIVNLNINGYPQFSLKNFLIGNRIAVIVCCFILCILSMTCNRRINKVILLVYLCFVVYMTLLYRNNIGLKANFIPLWSYKQFFINEDIRWQIIENIILFIPIGMILYSLLPKGIAVIMFVLISVCIEIVQYFTGSGLCEFDDIISNCFGGCLGCLIGKLTSDLKKRINSWKHIHNT